MTRKHCISKSHACARRRSSPAVGGSRYRQADSVSTALHDDVEASVNRIRSCQANQHGIPDNAGDIIRGADGHAESYLHGATVLSTLAGFSLSQDIDVSQNRVYQAYEDRFGPPPAVRGGFRDRFDRSRHADEDAAKASELGSLSDRLSRMAGHLSNGINYRCRNACRDDWVLWTQVGRNHRRINMCPDFFTSGYSESQQAIGIIHELGHNRLRLDHHNANTSAQRVGNPECYASFVADIFGVNSWDSQCPPR
ncbi:hypothetical protein [Halomonas urumqiensis]|uniref:hypothetical protein n=1 Tax=Halomonas urumqiensis TaxID=1684789 RepID=UPI0011AF5B5C|nr:hypothetical protein [Halomonas urumqiensis]GHE20358.1 hypothetical protein GCM10017767_08790 [Halomonas urumqiensis]